MTAIERAELSRVIGGAAPADPNYTPNHNADWVKEYREKQNGHRYTDPVGTGNSLVGGDGTDV